MLKSYSGNCHCGDIRFTVEADLDERKAICRCSRCTMLGFLHHHVQRSNFKLLTDPTLITEYRFNTLHAVHTFCKRCGVQPYYTSRSDPDLLDINLRCLQGIDIYELDYELSDGRSWEDYQAVRKERERVAQVTQVPYRVTKWRILWKNPFLTFSSDEAFESSWK